MPITIKVNNLSLCHRASGGVSRATLPDVCMTPPKSVPVAYPNIAFSKDLAKGTATVFADGGNSIAHSPSEFAVSTGDEPGSAGGVKSGTFMKEATWLSFSMSVKLEGKGACRHSDKMLHNHGNTINASGLQNPPVGDGDADCKAMWDRVYAEAIPIIEEPDHQKRNKMITEKYASMYKRNPDYEWAGLAGVVSRQAGCNMIDAQAARNHWWRGGDNAPKKLFGGYAKNAYDALGEANKSIFKDIFPNHRFYELYGWEGVDRCSDVAGHEIPEDLKKAFKKMEEAKSKSGADKARALRDASNKIGEYEQKFVVQTAVYAREEYKKVLDLNERLVKSSELSAWEFLTSNPSPLVLGITMKIVVAIAGAKKVQIPLSSQCDAGSPIEFDGSISDPDDRVNYYHKLMNGWIKQRNADPRGWSKMYDEIINWSKLDTDRDGLGGSGDDGDGTFGGGSSGGGGAGTNW